MRFFLDVFPYYFVSDPKNCGVLGFRKQIMQTLKKSDKKDKPLYAFEKCAVLAKELTKRFSLPEGENANWMVLGIEWFWDGLWEYRYDEVFPLKEHLFEGQMFFVPNKFDKVLTREYGDYMRLPERVRPKHNAKWVKDMNEVVKMKEYIEEFSQKGLL
jgi:phosphorylcholine metabolism protein LicD